METLQKALPSEKNKRGWKTQGRGKHTIRPLPKNGFGRPPPTYDTFPPPRLFTQCHFPLRERAQTRPIPLSEASKTGFGGHALWYVFHPQNRTMRFASPLAVSQFLAVFPNQNQMAISEGATALFEIKKTKPVLRS